MTSAANARITTLAADRAVHRAFSWLHLHELRLRQWQLQIIAIPAPTFAESARAAFFLERFKELGLHEPHIDEAGNVLAHAAPPNTAATVLLSAHLDTVFPMETVVTPTEDGSRIVAPGACDNAAGLTALLGIAAAIRFADITPAANILFCANVGEEGEGNLRGMRHLLRPGNPHDVVAAIALEGSGPATVVDRALGSRRFRITVTGPGGHSWADAARPNPIFALAAALTAVSRIPLPASPRTTLHCGTITGGTSVNSVPESASATLDLRSVDAAQLDVTAAEVTAAIRAAFASTAALSLRIESIGDRPAAALAADSGLYTSLRAVDRHLRIATEPRIGSTDANFPLSLGIPALAIGCGGTSGGIHTLREWYDPAGRELALRRILLLLLDAGSEAPLPQLSLQNLQE